MNEKRMIQTMERPTADALQRVLTLKGSTLPSFPQAALKLLEMAGDESFSMKEMAQVIESDPGIAARVLQLVNAARYGLQRKISTLPEALVFLGVDEIRKLAIGMTVFQGLFATPGSKQFNRLHFWRHSLSVAVLAMDIAKAVQFPKPEEAYVAGLLHDVGKIFLDLQGRRDYGEFLHAAATSRETFVELERQRLGLGHDDVGAYFCSLWGLPEKIVLPVQYHHRRIPVEALSIDEALLIAMVALANFICWTQGVGSVESERIRPPVLAPEVEGLIDLERIDIVARISAMNMEMERISEFYRFVFPTPEEIQASMLRMSFNLARVQTEHAPPDIAAGRPHFSENGPASLQGAGFAFGASLAQARTVREIMDIVMEHIGTIFKPVHWSLLLKDPKSDDLIFSVVEGLNKERLQGLRLPKGKGLFGYMLEADAPLVVDAVSRNADLAHRLEVYSGFAPQSCMGALLTINKKLFGGVELVNKMNGTSYTAEELHILESIAEQACMAFERVHYQQALQKITTTDTLTGLKNRSCLERMLGNRDFLLRQYGDDLSIMIIDIDRFKHINLLKGRKAADDLLRQVADILRSVFRKSDNVFRYEGDKFIALLPGTDRQAADQARLRILKSFDARKGDMVVTLSIFVHSVKPADNARGLITFLEERLAQDKLAAQPREAPLAGGLQSVPKQEAGPRQSTGKKIYRKKVRLEGMFVFPEANSHGNILVEEIALTEIGFRMTTAQPRAKPGDLLEVSFHLDDAARSFIERSVVVRSVQGEQVDAEFYNPPPYAKDLGFYLLV